MELPNSSGAGPPSEPPPADDETIYEITDACLEAFERLIPLVPDDRLSSQSRPNLRGLRDDFSFWIDYSGALASAGASLDDRLHGLDEIKGMVLELLQMLGRNLLRLAHISKKGETSGDDFDRYHSATVSTLDRLHFLAKAIRKSSSKQPDAKPFEFTEFTNQDDVYFRNIAVTYVKLNCPRARPSLREHLGDTIARRRRALLVKGRHAGKLKSKRRGRSSARTDTQGQSEPAGVSHGYPRSAFQPSITGSKATEASKPDARALRRIMKRGAFSIQSSGILQRDVLLTIQYPTPPPLPHDDIKHVQCFYCLEPLPAVEIRKGISDDNKYWRHHLDRDLQPYACLFPACANYWFSNMKDWSDHMDKFHTPDWPRFVHGTTWFCDTDHDKPEEFDNESEWAKHMMETDLHPSHEAEPSEEQLKVLAGKKQQIALRDPDTCPFCESKPYSIAVLGDKGNPADKAISLTQHIGAHVKALSMLAFPSLACAADPASQEEPGSTGNLDESKKSTVYSGFPTQPISHGGDLESTSLVFFDDEQEARTEDGISANPAGAPSHMIAEHNDITVPDTGEEFSWHEVPLPELSQDPPWEPLPSTGQWTAQSGGQTLSTIHDQGYDAWLKQQAEDQEDESASRQSPRSPTHARSPSESRQSTAVLVAQTGAFFDAPWPSPPAQPPPSPQDFETEIRAALKVSASRDKGEYLPNDAFNRIVTRDRVRQELARLVPERIAADKLDWYTDQVWHTTPPVNSKSHDPRPTTRRKIFAILALIQMVPGIVRFIDDSDENVHDNDLPFLLSDGPDPGTRQLQRRGRDGNLSPITIVSSWPPFMHEVFNDYQWKLLPPYFVLSTTTRPEVPHYSFEYGTVLPLIEDEKIASGNTGGFGDVWKVKIHPAHHNRCHNASSDKDNPWYAIKRLRHSNREAFRVEVSNLKRFSTKDHLHIIKLLGTFEWRREFYLLFPCADGNLFDFWKLYPTVTELPRDHGFALWFSSQCLGLAKGLKSIHSFEVTQGEYLDIPQHEQDKTLGRHGDLIPENILWFRPVGPYLLHETDKGNMGVLKISDFALSKFHRPASVRSGQDGNGKSTPVSPRYRAPEFDIGQGVDQSYDIWTLGCVLLEFVAWYVLGWDEVERFSRSRVEDDYGEIKEDVFFNNVEIIHEEDEKKETWTEPGAQAKRAVYDEFQLLYKHERCSDFILDLLDFIEDRLLRIRPYKRAKCDEIVDKLTSLHKTCQENNRYCTERQKLDLRRSRTDLSLVASSALPYSDKQKKRIHQNAVPNIHPQPIFPSVASQLAAAGLVPSTSRTERYKEGINSIFSDRKDEHNTPYESFGELATSSAASIPVPSFTITVSPPPSKFTTTTSTTPPRSSCTEDTSNDTGNDTAVPFAQASTEATPSSSQQKPARRERWYKRILR